MALLSVLLDAASGILIGVTAGYYRGFFDQVAMGVGDIQLSMPFMLIAIFLAAVLGATTRNTILVLAITGVASYARILRGEVHQIRELQFVEASQALGASDWHTIRRAVFPNVIGSAVVVASIAVPRIILAEASLSFIGLGVQPPTPSWGTMIAETRNDLNVAWWTATFPGLAITLRRVQARTGLLSLPRSNRGSGGDGGSTRTSGCGGGWTVSPETDRPDCSAAIAARPLATMIARSAFRVKVRLESEANCLIRGHRSTLRPSGDEIVRIHHRSHSGDVLFVLGSLDGRAVAAQIRGELSRN